MSHRYPVQAVVPEEIVFRGRIVSKGRRTNRISCPREWPSGIKHVSFDKCRSRLCGHVRMLTERGVYCTFPSSSMRKRKKERARA